MKMYVTRSCRGKYEVRETFEEAKKICDQKSKRNKHKWVVHELTEGNYTYIPEQHFLSFSPARCPIVYEIK